MRPPHRRRSGFEDRIGRAALTVHKTSTMYMLSFKVCREIQVWHFELQLSRNPAGNASLDPRRKKAGTLLVVLSHKVSENNGVVGPAMSF